MYHAMNINHFCNESWNVGNRKAILFQTTTGAYGFRAFKEQIFVFDTILASVEKSTSYATVEELSKRNASQQAFSWVMEGDIMNNEQVNVIADSARALLREALKAEELAEEAYDRAAYEYPDAPDGSVIASRAVVDAAIKLVTQLNGERYREDEPAVEWADSKHWCLKGERHREDGPAVEYANGGIG